MGAVAFIMADITNIPYADIVAASWLPSILYVAIYILVHNDAVRNREPPMPADQIVPLHSAIANGWRHLLPIGAMMWLLLAGYTPVYVAAGSTAAVIVLSWFHPRSAIGPRRFVECCRNDHAGGAARRRGGGGGRGDRRDRDQRARRQVHAGDQYALGRHADPGAARRCSSSSSAWACRHRRCTSWARRCSRRSCASSTCPSSRCTSSCSSTHACRRSRRRWRWRTSPRRRSPA